MYSEPNRKTHVGRTAIFATVGGTLVYLTIASGALALGFPQPAPRQGVGWRCLDSFFLQPYDPRRPRLAWECSHWYPNNPSLAYGPAPSGTLPRAQKASGEDWWYDHKNSYDSNGRLIGYIAAGYSQFVQWAPSELPGGGCLLTQLGIADCQELESVGNVDGGIVATMALTDSNGSVVWSHAYEPGYFTRVIQTSDGGYLAIGRSYGTLAPDGTPLAYNPGQPEGCMAGNPSSISNAFSPGKGCPLNGGSASPHLLLVKTDSTGMVSWQHLYGIQPYDDPRDAYDANVDAWDVTETPEGNFITVGTTVDPNSNFLCNGSGSYPRSLNRGFVIEVDRHGMWRWGSFLPLSPANSQGPSFNNPSIVTAITRQVGVPGVPYNYVISGWYTTSECRQRIFAIQFSEPTSPPPPCPALPIVWQNFYVALVVPEAGDQSTFGIQIASRPGPVVILLPAVVNISGNEGDATVYSLDGNGTLLASTPITHAKAFDLRLMVVPTADGGFGVATSVPGDPMQKLTPPCDPTATPVPATSTSIPSFWNTDGFVAKYDIHNNRVWSTQFDNAAAPGVYPDDQKKQECLFAISDDGGGGFVVSGHNSYNFEDSYMVHVQPPISSPFPFIHFLGEFAPSAAVGQETPPKPTP
jgi:hypothetical protein